MKVFTGPWTIPFPWARKPGYCRSLRVQTATVHVKECQCEYSETCSTADQWTSFQGQYTAILHELVLSYSDSLRYVKGVANALKWSSAKSENTEIYLRRFQFVARRKVYLKCPLMGMVAVEAKYTSHRSRSLIPWHCLVNILFDDFFNKKMLKVA